MKRIFLLTLLLVGCGSSTSQPVPTSFDYESSATGLRAAVDPEALEGQTAHRLGEDIDLWYQTTLVCMSSNGWGEANVRGPIVHIVKDKINVNGITYDGWTDYDSNTVTMRAITANIWSHEFVHYLLNKAGLQNTHEHPAFSTCAP